MTTATPRQESPKPPLTLDLLSEVHFTQFDAELKLTPEARLLLGINEEQAQAVSKAAHEFRDAIELTQSQTAKPQRDDPMSQQEKLHVEVASLGPRLEEFTRHYQTHVQQALGHERPAFIAKPLQLGAEQSVLYRPSTSTPDRFHEIKLTWADANDGSSRPEFKHGHARERTLTLSGTNAEVVQATNINGAVFNAKRIISPRPPSMSPWNEIVKRLGL